MSEGKTTCQICHEQVHVIKKHLEGAHPEISLEKYQEMFPLAPILSPRAEAAVKAKLAERKETAVAVSTPAAKPTKGPLHELFGFGNNSAAMNSRGQPIQISVLSYDDDQKDVQALVPDRDRGYVFNPELVKDVCMALETNMPAYLYGHAGVGKSTLIEQICAVTNRGYIRVQHTGGMEEAHVEGQWIVNDQNQMEFKLGPLAEAMEQGLVYCADEYDFAPPQVVSLYQAVLEGKPLFIKSANRKIYPHKNFRLVGTGNTNGAGDEHALYNGTMVQNAANYERFGMMLYVPYMDPAAERALLIAKTGLLDKDAGRLVEYAGKMREAFDRKDVTLPISPRALLNAAKIGAMRGDFKIGLERSYIARLSETSRDSARDVAQRIFG